jgi:hypothetical protein
MAYTKTTWADKNVQFPNRFTKTGESAGGVTLVPDPGTVTQAGTALSASNMNKIEDGIAAAHAMATDAQSMPVTLAHGVNVLTTSNPSPARLTAYGLTRVNLLGMLGRSLDLSKYSTSGQTGTSVALSLDYSTQINNKPSIKITSDATSTNGGIVMSIPVLDNSKYYLFRMSAINNNVTDITFSVRDQSFSYVATTGAANNQTGKVVELYAKATPAQMAGISTFPKLYARANFVAGGGRYFNVNGFSVFEITAAEYAKIDVDPEWTGDKLADKFPYIDSVQHTQGVAVRQVGRNLLPPFGQWDVIHANAVINDQYNLTLTSSSPWQRSYVSIPVKEGTTFTISGITTARFTVFKGVGVAGASATNIGPEAFSSPQSFTIDSSYGGYITVAAQSSNSSGVFTFTNPQLELGSTATPFQPYNADYIYLPTNLASNLDGTVRDTAYEREGVWYKYKKWVTGIALEGSHPWFHHSAATGYKNMRLDNGVLLGSNTNLLPRVLKYNGNLTASLASATSFTDIDQSKFTSGPTLLISVGNADTGWSDAFTPTSTDMKAYFNGWKMNNGILGTAYPGTGTKYWTAIESPRANFMGKVAGSVVENPNKVWFTSGGSLQNPSGQADSVTQTGLNNLMYLDGTTANGTVSTNAQIAQQMFSFNLIEHVLRKYGSAVFGAAVTTADRVTWLKANIGRIAANWYGYGSGPAGNKATFTGWRVSGSIWDQFNITNVNSAVAKYTATTSSSGTIGGLIDTNGFVHFLAYADASDGVTASTVFTDFIDLEVELNVQTVPVTGLATTEFKPYKLDYVLSTPVEEALTSGGGGIALQSGGNQVELLEGVVWQEVITPIVNGNSYTFNNTAKTGSTFKNKVSAIIAVYKDGVSIPFGRTRDSFAYGLERGSIDPAQYDPASDYTATYINLDKYAYTVNAVEAKLEYQTSLGSAVAANVQDIADIKNSLSIIMFAMIMADIL